MTNSAVNASNAASAASSASATPVSQPSASDKARKQISGDFDTFLKLLTTQLKNQDPTQPMDTNQFTSQLVQFANVEQSINANTNLEKLINLQQGSQINSAVGYIGKYIEATGSSSMLQNHKAAFTYALAAKADSADITITNSAGTVVFNGKGLTDAGKNTVLWDGTSTVDGTTVPDGEYKITVKAKDGDGNDITATPFTTGFVSSVDLVDGAISLSIGSIKFSMDKIRSITAPVDANISTGA